MKNEVKNRMRIILYSPGFIIYVLFAIDFRRASRTRELVTVTDHSGFLGSWPMNIV